MWDRLLEMYYRCAWYLHILSINWVVSIRRYVEFETGTMRESIVNNELLFWIQKIERKKVSEKSEASLGRRC